MAHSYLARKSGFSASFRLSSKGTAFNEANSASASCSSVDASGTLERDALPIKDLDFLD